MPPEHSAAALRAEADRARAAAVAATERAEEAEQAAEAAEAEEARERQRATWRQEAGVLDAEADQIEQDVIPPLVARLAEMDGIAAAHDVHATEADEEAERREQAAHDAVQRGEAPDVAGAYLAAVGTYRALADGYRQAAVHVRAEAEPVARELTDARQRVEHLRGDAIARREWADPPDLSAARAEAAQRERWAEAIRAEERERERRALIDGRFLAVRLPRR